MVRNGVSPIICIYSLRFNGGAIPDGPSLCTACITAGNFILGFHIAISGQFLQLRQTVLCTLTDLNQLFFSKQTLDIPNQTTSMYVLSLNE